MARRGPQAKNPAMRQRRNELTVVRGDRLDFTGVYPDKRWLDVTKASWDAFWGSDVAAAVAGKDLATLERLFHLRNMTERFRRDVNKNPTTTGSQGQDVLNPKSRLMSQMLSEVRQLEREFGLTPDAGARMVQSAAVAQRSVDAVRGDDDDSRYQIIAVDKDSAS